MLELKAEKRDKEVKVDSLREEGKIPAVFYGRKEESTPIVVSTSDFKKTLKEAGESTVVTLKTPEKDVSVLIHDVSFEPVSGEPLHVDFYAVEADKKVEVPVSISFTGVAPAEKNLGGVLVKVLHELTVSGLPQNLPHEIEVDLSTLETMDSVITAGNITLPKDIELVHPPEEVIASITQAKEEEEEPSAEFNPDAVEVEAKGKEEEASDEEKE